MILNIVKFNISIIKKEKINFMNDKKVIYGLDFAKWNENPHKNKNYQGNKYETNGPLLVSQTLWFSRN